VWAWYKPGSSKGEVLSVEFGPGVKLRFAAIVTRTTIPRNCSTSQANLPENVRGLNSPLNPREFWIHRHNWIVVFLTRVS